MSDSTATLRDALARTVLLAKLDIFPSLDPIQIADGLATTSVRIVSDAENLSTASAQTLVVASAICLAQSGAAVVLDMPEVAMVVPQPPLPTENVGLVAALRTHLDELPSATVTRSSTAADVVVLVGDTRDPDALLLKSSQMLRVTGDNWSTRLIASVEHLPRWEGDQPFGALLGACAIGAEAFRSAMRKLALQHDVTALPEHRLAPAERIELAVAPIENPLAAGGRVDFVSAGAITNASLFSLLRVPDIKLDARIFDDDTVQVSNLNRYPMLSRAGVDVVKVDALADQAPDGWSVEPVPVRLGATTIDAVVPLSGLILIGVDDIPSRWLVQRFAPDWVCVGATSHFEVVISEHERGGPCAGCMHPRDEPDDGPIPTVAFVSMLAGALQAHRLVARLTGGAAQPPMIAWAFSLDGKHAFHNLGQSPREDCPVKCAASEPLREG